MPKNARTLFAEIAWTVVPFIVIAIILAVAVQISQPPLEFKAFTPDDVSRLISSLLIVTVFLERTLEIFVTALREPRAKELERESLRWKDYTEKYASHPAGQQPEYTLEDALKYHRLAEEACARYRSGTQRFAMWLALLMGLLVSGVGLRALEVFVDTSKVSPAYPNQLAFFRIIDILITGGLLAGGSDGIHKVTKLLDTFWQRSQENLKNPPATREIAVPTAPEIPLAPPPPIG